jgi:hypothetical protein
MCPIPVQKETEHPCVLSQSRKKQNTHVSAPSQRVAVRDMQSTAGDAGWQVQLWFVSNFEPPWKDEAHALANRLLLWKWKAFDGAAYKRMICYCVLFHCSLVGVFSCAADAAQCAKGLHGSTVVQCHLNDYTDTGKQIVRNPA